MSDQADDADESGELPGNADLFAPDGGWVVRIIDLSGGAEDNIVEEIKGFPNLIHANAFARAYVRDSVELCRVPGMAPREVLSAWFSFGEDAEVIDAGEDGWRSANELDDFASRSATEMERDWRSLDPRREAGDEEEEGED
ncbi:hypothetical protein [Rhizosaccharibacter radicis]|uniref:DUF5076 domain-containing protein n=1 Tax=Rhizosaccharibacter radicis TaxID=2782605 RepID=A0ABT1W211_9PROT|nr:hypothetical protein [Acetobacteraceae bacterium KSS12]